MKSVFFCVLLLLATAAWADPPVMVAQFETNPTVAAEAAQDGAPEDDSLEVIAEFGGSLGNLDSTYQYGFVEGGYFPWSLSGEGGTHSFGIGFRLSDSSWESMYDYDDFGSKRRDKGDTSLWAVGPAYKYDAEGWAASAKILFGQTEVGSESFFPTAHHSHRSVREASSTKGVSLSYENTARENAGENWFPGMGVYLTTFWRDIDPPDRHSLYFEDTASEDNLTLSLVYFQDIYWWREEGVRSYFSLGYFSEEGAKSSGFRLGVADGDWKWYAGVGPDWEGFLKGKPTWGWTAGLDVVAVVRALRDDSRRGQMAAALGE